MGPGTPAGPRPGCLPHGTRHPGQPDSLGPGLGACPMGSGTPAGPTQGAPAWVPAPWDQAPRPARFIGPRLGCLPHGTRHPGRPDSLGPGGGACPMGPGTPAGPTHWASAGVPARLKGPRPGCLPHGTRHPGRPDSRAPAGVPAPWDQRWDPSRGGRPPALRAGASLLGRKGIGSIFPKPEAEPPSQWRSEL